MIDGKALLPSVSDMIRAPAVLLLNLNCYNSELFVQGGRGTTSEWTGARLSVRISCLWHSSLDSNSTPFTVSLEIIYHKTFTHIFCIMSKVFNIFVVFSQLVGRPWVRYSDGSQMVTNVQQSVFIPLQLGCCRGKPAFVGNVWLLKKKN